MGVDPVNAPVPVRPTVHYTMGGIETDGKTATSIPGLYAAGECASVGIHGANRLGSNSLVETVVFGRVAGEEAARFAEANEFGNTDSLEKQAEASVNKALSLIDGERCESVAQIRNEMGDTMEEGIGIYRDEESIKNTIVKLTELKERYKNIKVNDTSTIFNTDWLSAIELGFLLGNAEAMAYSALNRRESRGSHQRLDYVERDDEKFLKHSLATYNPDGAPTITYSNVKITKLPPAKRVYGIEAENAEKAAKEAAAKGGNN